MIFVFLFPTYFTLYDSLPSLTLLPCLPFHPFAWKSRDLPLTLLLAPPLLLFQLTLSSAITASVLTSPRTSEPVSSKLNLFSSTNTPTLPSSICVCVCAPVRAHVFARVFIALIKWLLPTRLLKPETCMLV